MPLVGDLTDLALVDIIQINCVGRNTARLTVHYPIGDGVFYFADGEVVDARLGNLVGAEAVYKALEYDQGAFRIDTGIPAPTRTIFEPWANLIMEGLRLLDEARAGRGENSEGATTTAAATAPTPTTTSGAARVINIYQVLVNDLTKIKGVDMALAVSRDGTVQAASKVKSAEKLGMMVALLVHLGRLVSVPARVGNLSRMTISVGPKKVMVLDLENYLAMIEFGAAVRFETISPHIDRVLRKMQARINGATDRVSTGLLGSTGPLTPPGPYAGPLTM
jgi:predicted regulator of Ras-like GTPase activity (Roadblock/LC7/MglB family)